MSETITKTEDEIVEAKRQLAYRLENEKYRYYEPSGKGEEFINKVASGDNFITLYSAANGVGKTATAVNLLAHLFWPTGENDFFQFDLFKNWPYPKRLRIVSDPTNIEKNIVPAMEDWFPAGKYQRWKGNKKYWSIWKTDTGWEIEIMSYEQHPKEFEGATLGLVWFDEPPPEAIYKANISRLRKGGHMFITATPLAGSAYLYDLFAKGEVDIEIEGVDGAKLRYTRKIGYVEADVESACRTHGIRGHLNHDIIQAMIAEYDDDDKQARIYGKFQHLIGLIYKRFTRNIHVIKPFPINKKDFCVYEYIDPHPRNPDAVLWVAVDKNGTKYVVNELFHKPQSIAELSERIKDRGVDYRIIWRKGDPSMFNVNQHDEDGKSLGDRLVAYGLSYLEASKRRQMADRRIEDALNYTQIQDHMVKAPELYIFDSCQRTIWEMEHYRWDEYTGINADKHGKKEKPVDKDDHMIENLGRCLLDEPPFIEWIQETNPSAHGFSSNYSGTSHKKNSDDPYD
jgi:phage terminase large subunit-like protein